MKRDVIYKEMEDTFGLVPSFFKLVPEDTLEYEWGLFKKIQLAEGSIPNKYRELMGLAMHSVTKCQYCTLFHTEMARLYGATDEEIEAAVHYAKESIGWSAYVNGMQVDYETFKDELRRAALFVKGKMEKKAA